MKTKHLLLVLPLFIPTVCSAWNDNSSTFNDKNDQQQLQISNTVSQTAANGTNEKKVRYEGMVSLAVGGPVFALGGYTSHGARFIKERLTVGGTLGWTAELFGYYNTFVGAFPKWYFANGKKLDGYIACHLGGLIGKYDRRGANGIRETGTDYGFQAMPEIGFGVKLKRNMAVDFSVKFCTAYMTGDWWWNRAMLCIGFRF